MRRFLAFAYHQTRAFLAARHWVRHYSAGHNQGRIVPLDTVLQKRALAGAQTDPMMPPLVLTCSDGKRLQNEYLAQKLAQEQLGAWALDAEAINFLGQQIADKRLRSVLEFGAGLSTLCLARMMFQLHGQTEHPVVFSIEQHKWQVIETHQRLADWGLESMVSILHAPLVRQKFGDQEHECYWLPPDVLTTFLGDTHPDFILIDGPAAEEGARLERCCWCRSFWHQMRSFFWMMPCGMANLRLRNIIHHFLRLP